jgi:hypothetical protein
MSSSSVIPDVIRTTAGMDRESRFVTESRVGGAGARPAESIWRPCMGVSLERRAQQLLLKSICQMPSGHLCGMLLHRTRWFEWKFRGGE